IRPHRLNAAAVTADSLQQRLDQPPAGRLLLPLKCLERVRQRRLLSGGGRGLRLGLERRGAREPTENRLQRSRAVLQGAARLRGRTDRPDNVLQRLMDSVDLLRRDPGGHAHRGQQRQDRKRGALDVTELDGRGRPAEVRHGGAELIQNLELASRRGIVAKLQKDRLARGNPLLRLLREEPEYFLKK